MSAPVAEAVRAVLGKLTEPDHAGEFTDALIQLAIADDSHENEAVREDAQRKADELLGELSESVAAEIALREQVAA